jgi:hypothetical protein
MKKSPWSALSFGHALVKTPFMGNRDGDRSIVTSRDRGQRHRSEVESSTLQSRLAACSRTAGKPCRAFLLCREFPDWVFKFALEIDRKTLDFFLSFKGEARVTGSCSKQRYCEEVFSDQCGNSPLVSQGSHKTIDWRASICRTLALFQSSCRAALKSRNMFWGAV